MVFPPTKITFLIFSSDFSVGSFTLFESELESSAWIDSSFIISPVWDSATAAASERIFSDSEFVDSSGTEATCSSGSLLIFFASKSRNFLSNRNYKILVISLAIVLIYFGLRFLTEI